MKKSKALLIIIVVLALTLGIGYMDIWGYDGNGAGNASDIKLQQLLQRGDPVIFKIQFLHEQSIPNAGKDRSEQD